MTKGDSMSFSLNPSEISELIKQNITGFDSKAEIRTEGTVTSVRDGVLRIHGLDNAMYGEMIECPGKVFAMALNLDAT
jgi:F-type H+/Na+-transporting ATPase subunit alpha